MAMQTHLAELVRRHRALEEEINDAIAHPSSDGLMIVEFDAFLAFQLVADRNVRAPVPEGLFAHQMLDNHLIERLVSLAAATTAMSSE